MGIISALLAIPGLLSGLFGTINGITNAISNEKIAQLTTMTQQEQIASNERISALQQRRDVLIADAAHGSLDIWIRSGIAIGPAMYLFKIFAIDKVFGFLFHTSTDPLDPNLWNVVMVVLGFYFLSETSTRITRIVASKLGRK
jgi:divalent metal cation (Fe/Co/Zn/Cd) transporter